MVSTGANSISISNGTIELVIGACPHIPFVEVTDGFRIFYGIYVATMCIMGIFANFLLCTTILVNRRIFLKIEVYHISISQTIIGSIYFLAYLTVAVPVILESYEYISHMNVMILVSTLDTFTYYTEQAFLVVIGLNRFIHMCLRIRDVHTFLATKILHFCAWLFGISMVIGPSLYGCFKVFTPRLLEFTFACADCEGVDQIYSLVSEICPGILLFLYLIILLRLQLVRRKFSSNISLTIQCLCITVPSLIGPLCFFFIFSWFPGNGYVGIIPMTLSGIIMMANPIVLFLFNEKVRKSMFTLVTKRQAIEEISKINLTRRGTTTTTILSPVI